MTNLSGAAASCAELLAVCVAACGPLRRLLLLSGRCNGLRSLLPVLNVTLEGREGLLDTSMLLMGSGGSWTRDTSKSRRAFRLPVGCRHSSCTYSPMHLLTPARIRLNHVLCLVSYPELFEEPEGGAKHFL